MNPRVNYLLLGNIRPSWSVVQIVNWILWALLAWLVVSVAVALIAGRVIRARDQQEIPPAIEDGGDDEIHRAG